MGSVLGSGNFLELFQSEGISSSSNSKESACLVVLLLNRNGPMAFLAIRAYSRTSGADRCKL